MERISSIGDRVVITDRGENVEGNALLVAVGRRLTMDGLDLERAGVAYTDLRRGPS